MGKKNKNLSQFLESKMKWHKTRMFMYFQWHFPSVNVSHVNPYHWIYLASEGEGQWQGIHVSTWLSEPGEDLEEEARNNGVNGSRAVPMQVPLCVQLREILQRAAGWSAFPLPRNWWAFYIFYTVTLQPCDF